MGNKHQIRCELQKDAVQDEFQKEILMAAERLQVSDNQLEQHRKAQEDILEGLPKTTTWKDFQKFIRDARDRKHVYTQDENWTAAEECMMEVKSLVSRQARLGELEHREKEEYMECELQIRAINHQINRMEVNNVQDMQEGRRLNNQKQAYTLEGDAWNAFTEMRNNLKEPKKPESVERDKKEIDREVETSQDQLTEKPDNTVELRDNDKLHEHRQLEFEEHQRRQNITLDNRDRKNQQLKVEMQIYERLLQLGNHKAAAKILAGIEEFASSEN
jgi:hypothetical protein